MEPELSESRWLFSTQDASNTQSNSNDRFGTGLSSIYRRFRQVMGVLLALACGLSYGTAIYITSYISGNGVSPIQQNVLAYGTVFIAFLPVVIFQKVQLLYPDVKQTILLVSFGIIYCLQTISVKFSVAMIPIAGNATAIKIACFVFFSIIGDLVFYKDPLLLSQVLASVISIVGVLLITHPIFLFGSFDSGSKEEDSTSFHIILGYCLALVSGVMFAAVLLISRGLAEEVSVHARTFYASLLTALLCTMLIACGVQTSVWTMSPNIAWNIVALCIFLSIGTYCLNFSSRDEKAAVVSIVITVELPVTYTLQYIVSGDHPVPIELAGSVVICLAIFVLVGNIVWKHCKPTQENNTV
ncbi:solute carrier family 35 member G2-like [Glandiceps talaboti]